MEKEYQHLLLTYEEVMMFIEALNQLNPSDFDYKTWSTLQNLRLRLCETRYKFLLSEER